MPLDPTEASLLARLKPYAHENRGRTWALTLSTLAAIAIAGAGAVALPRLPLRLVAGLLEGLLLVRGFSIFHDTMHGAVFRGSAWGRALMAAFGFLESLA